MKGNLNVILLLAPTIVLAVSSSALKYSVSKFDDVEIINENGILRCDQIECPAGSIRCHATKKTSKENSFKLKRENTCYDENDKVLKEKSWTEENKKQKIVNIDIEMYLDDGSSVISQDYINTSNIISRSMELIGDTIDTVFDKVGSMFQRFFYF